MASIKSFINFENKYDRVIVLVDMDCFYCQVEEKLNPELLAGKPIAVVQVRPIFTIHFCIKTQIMYLV